MLLGPQASEGVSWLYPLLGFGRALPWGDLQTSTTTLLFERYQSGDSLLEWSSNPTSETSLLLPSFLFKEICG